MKYTIAGTTGVGAVKLAGLPAELTSGATGSYSVTAEFGWTGTITPEKEGYTFEPATLFLGPIEKDLAKQDFKAKPMTSTIAGNVGMPGAMLQGLPGRVVSGPDGSYTVEVPFKWSGTVMPMKDGFTFDPAKKEYKDVRESATAENYTGAVKQYVISGRITSEKGPLTDVLIITDKPNVSAMTDANGDFKLNVDHNWTGKITPQKDGCTFTPNQKPIGPVTQNVTNQSFAGKMRMMTISDKIALPLEEGKPPEPIQGVVIAAKPGDFTATTDAKGRYTIQVPYNWTGELFMAKPGIIFEPASILYQNVTENYENGLAKPVSPGPQTTGPQTTGPQTAGPKTAVNAMQPGGPETVPGGPGTATTKPVTPIGPAPVEKAKLQAQIDNLRKQLETTTSIVEKASLQRQIDDLRKQVATVRTTAPDANEPATVQKGTSSQGPVVPPETQSNQGPLVSGTFAGSVIDVLMLISQKTGAKVYADATVKPDVMIQPVTITTMPMASALPMILKGTKYTFRRIDKPEEGYQVFLPITNTFSGDQMQRALQDISATAGVAIVSDETVAGQVYADLQGVPLEVALETILAGSSYVYKKTPNYYLVADRKVEGSAFDKISETRRVRLNYITPAAAKSLLSTAFSPYVQAEADPNSHTVTVTAPTSLTERIVGELKGNDIRPRHVLLDARIVAMERGDLLNIGVEWGMPTAQAGFNSSAWEHGTLPADQGDPAGNSPWGISVGLSFDKTFTNSLTAALNLLKENNKVDILSSPQVVGRDGKRSRIQVVTEEYFMMTAPLNQSTLFYSQSQLETVKSGTTLEITPLIGDNNDITLELAVEVSDSIPKGRGSDLPVVTRRTAQNYVTIRDGGTVAVAGLTENRTRDKESKVPFFGDLPLIGAAFRNKNNDKATREIAVFVTAHLVPETSQLAGQLGGQLGGPSGGGRIMSPANDSFRQELKDQMSRQ
jgi:type IV pilus assembly protein PilQ